MGGGGGRRGPGGSKLQPERPSTGAAGQSLPGITATEQEMFRLGLEDFTEVETAEDGLGPAFNGNSCAVCHSVPAIGGVSTMTRCAADTATRMVSSTH